MAFPRLDIVDPENLSTVLWSFNDHTGAILSGFKTQLGPVQFGTDSDIQTMEFGGKAGGAVLTHRDRIVSSSAIVYVQASSADVRATNLGLLQKLLDDGGVMVWQPLTGSPLRYIDYLPSPRSTAYRGQHQPDLAREDEGLVITFLMQPYLRAAVVTSSPTSVSNDPATAGGRLLEATILGDLPTPVSLTSQMGGTSVAVQRLLYAHHQASAANIADLISDTAWAQLEASGRGWTRTAGTGASTATEANASPGTGVSANAVLNAAGLTVLSRRVRLTRTTKMNSLRGHWDVYLRHRTNAAESLMYQLRWGLGVVDPAPYPGLEVPYDSTESTTWSYVEKKLGSFYVPEDLTVPIGGLTLEVWHRRVSGSASAYQDLLFFVPRSGQGTVSVSGGSTSKIKGQSQHTSPPANISSDGFTFAAGSDWGEEGFRMDVSSSPAREAVGMGPNTGTVSATGRHIVTFVYWTNATVASNVTVVCRVVDITTNAIPVTITQTRNERRQWTVRLQYDAVGGRAYQPQIYVTAAPNNAYAQSVSITDQFMPALLSGEQIRTDPGTRYAVERLDSSGNIIGTPTHEGELPMLLDPGAHLIFTRADDVPVSQDEPQNVRTRTQTITLAYAPRYAL